MKKSLLMYGLAGLLITVGTGALLIYGGVSREPTASSNQRTIATVGDLSETYTNYDLGFALKMPEDFTSTEIPDDGGATTILLQNKQGDGIQILITPLGEDMKVLTPERIQEEIPDLILRDVEEVKVGGIYTGVAFKSNNEAFDKDSREVWFPFNGHLYQISTYARLDPLLKSMFATWKFF